MQGLYGETFYLGSNLNTLSIEYHFKCIPIVHMLISHMQISDFGMSRDLEDENYYVSHGTGKIPVKWTAPEVNPIH